MVHKVEVVDRNENYTVSIFVNVVSKKSSFIITVLNFQNQ